MRRHPDAERDRASARDPVPDRARGRGDPARLPAGCPRRRARPGLGAGDLPAAAALRGGVLRRPAGAARPNSSAHADVDWTGAAHDLCRRRRRARAHRPVVAGRLRARRHRVADRPGGRDRDRAPARRPASAGERDRGGKPGQRRIGADRLPGRGGGGGRRQLLALRREHRLRRRGGRRRRHRPGGRSRRRRGPTATRRHPGRNHHLAGDRLRRVPAGGGARRLGRARRGHRGDLPRLAGAQAGDPADAHAGPGGVGVHRLRSQRRAVRADRAPAPERRGRGVADRRGHPRGLRAGDGRRGGRRPLPVDVHDPLPAPGDRPPPEPGRAEGRRRPAGDHGLGRDARRRLTRGGALAATRDRRRRAVPRARPGDLPRLLRGPVHGRRPGADAARADPPAGRGRRRRGRGGRGAGGPDRGGRGGARGS